MNMTQAPNVRGALTVRDVSRVLFCSENTVLDLIHTRKLPAVRLGSAPKSPWRVSADALDGFLRGEVAA